MRNLRADRLFDLPSGLWVVDEVAPVAAILSPTAAPRLVSWAQVPPARTIRPWPPGRMLDDGECLWVQVEQGAPAVRVGPEGVRLCAWTDGRWLAATGPGVAWFSSAPPGQEIVEGADAAVPWRGGCTDLVRIDAAGLRDVVDVEGVVHDLHSGPDALYVPVEVPGHTLREIGNDSYEVNRSTAWLQCPWTERLPELLSVTEHAARVAPVARWVDGGRLDPFFDDPDVAPIEAGELRWRVGEQHISGSRHRQAVLTAETPDGSRVARWELGAGYVPTLIPYADGVAFVVVRPSSMPREAGPTQVLALSPGDDQPRPLLTEGLDIASLVPLTRPLDADSYAAAMLGRYPVPALTGVADAEARLVGAWPDTRLEWTFTHPSRRSLILRRRLSLFDDLGRLDEPEYCDIHLQEDLDTDGLPPAGDARDGVLDI